MRSEDKKKERKESHRERVDLDNFIKKKIVTRKEWEKKIKITRKE